MIGKPLKPFGKFKPKVEPTTKLGKLLQTVKDFIVIEIYYTVESFFNRYIERISRSLAFAKRGWLHYDFESAYLYDIMAFKLKRIYPVLKNGYAVQEKENMDALKEAIAICERLFAGNYDDKYHKAHNKKWGKIDILDDKRHRVKAKTPAQKEQERKEFMKCWEDGEKDRIADLDRLNEILKKHEPTWWD